MTQQEFVDKWRHQFGGLVLDVLACGLTGPELSARLRRTLQTIDTHLANAYRDAHAEKPLPARPTNGHPATPVRN